MLDNIRYPSKLNIFVFFTLLQIVLFVPVVIFFSLYSEANNFIGFWIAYSNTIIAFAVTLIAMIVLLCISRGESASFVVPPSFLFFILIFDIIFEISLLRWSHLRPHEWEDYFPFVIRWYSLTMIILSSIIATCRIIYIKIKGTPTIDID